MRPIGDRVTIRLESVAGLVRGEQVYVLPPGSEPAARGVEAMAEWPVREFAVLLRQLRLDAGLTQEELADAAHLSPRSISDLERGINRTARKDTARLLADALGLAGAARAGFEAAARGRLTRPVTPGMRPASTSAVAVAQRTLPRDVASFSGRESELSLLLDAVDRAMGPGGVAGIHAIDGMAGVGKTTFAVHAAHILSRHFPDGQIFLPLHAHRAGQAPVDPADALASLLLAAGVPGEQLPSGLQARESLWRTHMSGKRVLILLDDAAGHEQVRPLLPGNPGSLILITSRRRLTALDATTTISLDILSDGEAATLFERLAARPDITAITTAVRKIVDLSGYLPLAVGMLARQLHHHPNWTAEALAGELAAARNRLALMHAENLSVAAAFDLSYQDLTDEQQRMFRRLGLHPGTEISPGASAALDGIDRGQATQILDELYDQHLISEPARYTYRMHDLIREYARALAATDDSNDCDAAIGRLVDFYVITAGQYGRQFDRGRTVTAHAKLPAHARELLTRDQAAGWLEAERVNLQATVDYARQRGWHGPCIEIPTVISGFLRTRGYWGQARTLHRAALASARAVGDRDSQAHALTCLGMVERLTGDYSSATQTLTQALDLYQDRADLRGQATVLLCLGVVQRLTVEYSTAAITLTEAMRLYQGANDQLGQADALNELGYVQGLVGDHQSAIASHRRALGLYRSLDDQAGEADSLRYLGRALQETGEYAEVITSYELALDLYRRLDDQLGQAHALSFLGVAQQLTPAYLLATNTLAKALDMYRMLGHRLGQAEVLNNLGDQLLVSDPGQARAHYLQALDIARQISSPLEEARALEGVGNCDVQEMQITRGTANLRQAMAIYVMIGHPHAVRVHKTILHHGG